MFVFLVSSILSLAPLSFEQKYGKKIIESIIQFPYLENDDLPLAGINCHIFANMSFWFNHHLDYDAVALFHYHLPPRHIQSSPITKINQMLFKRWDIIQIGVYEIDNQGKTSYRPFHSILVLDHKIAFEKDGEQKFELIYLSIIKESLIKKSHPWLYEFIDIPDLSKTLITVFRPTQLTLDTFKQKECFKVIKFIGKHKDTINALILDGLDIFKKILNKELLPSQSLESFRKRGLLHKHFVQFFPLSQICTFA